MMAIKNSFGVVSNSISFMSIFLIEKINFAYLYVVNYILVAFNLLPAALAFFSRKPTSEGIPITDSEPLEYSNDSHQYYGLSFQFIYEVFACKLKTYSQALKISFSITLTSMLVIVKR
jgi:hypothetical protein